MDWLGPALEQYGMWVFVGVVMCYWAQSVRSQSMLNNQLVAGWNASQTQYATLGTTVTLQATESRQRDTALLDYLRNNDTLVSQLLERVLTGQNTMIVAQDNILRKVNNMAEQADWEKVLSELQEIKVTVNEIKEGINAYGGRLEVVEEKLVATEATVQAMAPKPTEAPPPAPRTKREAAELATKPPAMTKTQAQRKTDEQEIPAVKPEDKPTDAIPKGN